MAGKWITWSDKPSRLMVWVDGEIDIDNAGHLRDFLASQLTHDDITELVLDCSQVSFMDSSGLHALVASARRADLLTCEFVLMLDPNGPVQRLITLTDMAGMFTIRTPKPAAIPPVPPSATRIPVLPTQRGTEPAAASGHTRLPHLNAVIDGQVTDLRTATPVSGS